MKKLSLSLYRQLPVGALNEEFQILLEATLLFLPTLPDQVAYNFRVTMVFLKHKKRKTINKKIFCDENAVYEEAMKFIDSSPDIVKLKNEILNRLEIGGAGG